MKIVSTLVLLMALISNYSLSQCTFTSSNGTGYEVTISLTPYEIVQLTTPSDCGSTVNYGINLFYSVNFRGKSPNGGLNTLNGILYIGNDQLSFDLPEQGGSGVTMAVLVNPCDYRDQIPQPPVQATIHIQGPGISNQVNAPCELAGSPLPVELTAFEGVQNGNGIRLNWTTASERNNDYFIIQKSTNGTDFATIDYVKGSGTTTVEQNYVFEDQEPAKGVNYYKLIQVDYDGTQEEKGVISVDYTKSDNVYFYPNPVAGTTLFVDEVADGSSLQIISMQGTLIKQMDLTSITEIQLNDVMSGTYFFRILDKNFGTVTTERIIIR
ncbi:hypothetical protein GCM10009118_32270 [Wandonia haliotis]|uniref:Secretion system C-terminal sorting domain-containing protein n=1 Tax=Wandonia haliotis TaxID=574963 RepID=A0ABP3Y7D5_9FLAO